MTEPTRARPQDLPAVDRLLKDPAAAALAAQHGHAVVAEQARALLADCRRQAVAGQLPHDQAQASSLVLQLQQRVDQRLASRLRPMINLTGTVIHTNLGRALLADAALQQASVVVWAVKPQLFVEAAAPCAPFVGQALQLSVMAGIRCAGIEAATGSARIVRAMPNTPALIGQGMAGLYARPGVTPAQQRLVERLFKPTGRSLWVAQEADLDAVTALSGSGPAYGFYLIEAMVDAAQQMGLGAAQAQEMAIQTVLGAALLAQQSPLSPAQLRAQVTSKGGTTHAAITSLDADGVKDAFVRALLAAQTRARELGDAFGA